MKIQVIIEKGDGELWGRVQNCGNFLPTTVAKDTKGVIKNINDLIEDYLQHEGKDDPFWKKAIGKQLEFELLFDLQAFFEEHEYLKISAIATRAGLNAGLVRQYASGVKYPSIEQASKLEKAIRALEKELVGVALYA